MFVVVPAPDLRREQGGCSSLFLSMIVIWHKTVVSLVMWSFMTWDVNDGVLLSLWQHLARSYLFNERTKRVEKVLWSLAIFAELLGISFSSMSSSVQFQLHSGYQVLPPRRRWDLCPWQLYQFRRRDSHLRFVGEGIWRCRAEEFLLGSLAGSWDGL